MAAPRRVIEISIGEEDLARLEAIARSRTEPACRVERARILRAYRADPSAYAVGEAIGVTHQTVLRCLDRAMRPGVMAALDDSPRPGKAPEITDDARAWLVSLACRKARDLGYPHELWTTRLLARHVREHAAAAGHPSLESIVQGTVCKILARHEVKPHKVRYFLERRDEAFEAKMAEVLCVYREVAILRAREDVETNVAIKAGHPGDRQHRARPAAAAGVSCDLCARSRIQTPWHAEPARRDRPADGQGDRHRSREFIGFLKRLDAAYPSDTAIKLILDNHAAHISKETRAWLATQPEGRFSFVFTPKHGSWLNLVEGFFSRMARSMLRHIRVASKVELKARILACLEDLNREPVIHTWSYKIGEAA